MTYTLQILHASDLEGGVDAIANAPNFAAIVDALEGQVANSILLSAGDNYIPGPFFGAAGDFSLRDDLDAAYEAFYGVTGLGIREGDGRADITIMNLLGFDASAVGNHEFDAGTDAFAGLVSPDIRGPNLSDIRWVGAQFPYLSANLDFSGDAALAGLFDATLRLATEFGSTPAEYLAGLALAAQFAPATVIEENGENIGVIGATTQLVDSITSNGGVSVIGGNGNDMAVLAAVLQPQIDALVLGLDGVNGTADDINKIVLTTHLQDINLETELASLLRGVDVIIAGGSDTLLADAQDTLRAGDVAASTYPRLVTDADGNPVAIVSTDGEYSYVGRLVVEFDANGVIIPASIDENVSGAFATDEAGVLAVTGEATLADAIANSVKATEVEKIAQAVEDVITAKDGLIFGETDVFLEGNREKVRTEETNLGNLTADANIAAVNAAGPFPATINLDGNGGDEPATFSVQISIKNGGGIRSAIGAADNDGNLLPTPANPLVGKDAGDVSQLDIENSLRFNNQLTVGQITPASLLEVLEHAVAAVAPGATPGSFAQVGGFQFSYDPTQPAGSRIDSVALLNDDGTPGQVLVKDGAVVADAPAAIGIVTLNFMADGGDGYPFPALLQNRTDTGIGEQQALADFMAANFPDDDLPGNNFDAEDTAASVDTRIQNLSERAGSVAASTGTGELTPTLFAEFDSLGGETGAEIVAHENGKLYVTNGTLGQIDIFDLNGGQPDSIDLTFIAGFNGEQSVAVKNGIVAVAIDIENETVNSFFGPVEVGANGVVAFFDAATKAFLGQVEVGNLPDMVTFSPDGTTLLVANEGQFNEDSSVDINPLGTISKIDISGGVGAAVVTEINFNQLLGFEDMIRDFGIRLQEGESAATDFEPEYIAFAPDGTTAYVTLQENNAVAVIDVASGALVNLLPLGTVDRSLQGFEFDPNDNDIIEIKTFEDVVGMRMPDSIASFEVGGLTFFATANEGDGRGDARDGTDLGRDEARVSQILAGDVAGVSIDASVDTTGLERLAISTRDGDTDGDGDIDVLHAFGSRSFTIFDEMGNVVFDSGSEFAALIADIAPERFNDDGGNGGENRSDAKGVEPEAVEIGVIDGQTYAFIGLERDSGIVIYNVTDPANSQFVDYISGFEPLGVLSHESPEGIKFIPAAESPTGNAMIAVSYEVSGTTAVYEFTNGLATSSKPEFTNLPETSLASPFEVDSGAANQRLVLNVDAVDPDGGALSFAITGGADAGMFFQSAATGAIGSRKPFGAIGDTADADGDGIFELELTVTAADGDSTTETFLFDFV